MVPEELAIVERFGGQVVAANLWESLKGFSSAKEILERGRRPSRPRRARRAARPRPSRRGAALRPPWTGKTSFARAMASRLSWAFVEIHPSLLGQGVEGGRALRDTLSELGKVDRLVCFIDEADEIASDRSERPDSQPRSTNCSRRCRSSSPGPTASWSWPPISIDAIDPPSFVRVASISSFRSELLTGPNMPTWPPNSFRRETPVMWPRGRRASPRRTSPWLLSGARSWPSTVRWPAVRRGRRR